MIGLLEAFKRFETTKGASFETYAGIRIRGAIIDEVRKSDWAPRSVRRNGRAVSTAIKALEGKLGREVGDAEVAKEMNVGLGEYHEMLQANMMSQLFSFEEMLETEGASAEGFDSEESGPYSLVEDADFQQQLAQEIDQLTRKRKISVIALL